MRLEKFPFAELVIDERCQARAERSPEVVQEYADAYRAKAEMPPIDVFIVDGMPWVVDGMHRWAAHAAAKVAWVKCRVVGTGTSAEAIYRALAANQTNGMRRTNADKRKAVRMALENEIGVEQSNVVLAAHIGVGKDLVSEIRAEWEQNRRPRQAAETQPEPTRRKGKDGKSYPATPPKRAPKERVVLDPPSVPYPAESDEPLPHETPAADMPTYGAELERVAKTIARVRVDASTAQLPNSFLQSLASGLKSTESMLRYAVPEKCPRCDGAKCMHCRSRGWVTKQEADGLRASVKAAER